MGSSPSGNGSPGNGSAGGPAAFIGVDVGGTHTDVCAVVGGEVERGKSLTTYDDFSRGVLDAVGVAAEKFDLSTEELLARTKLFVNGTTVVTNSITTLQGSPVGVVVTSGFKDTFRFAGGPRLTEFDDHLQKNVPDLTAREAIREVEERVNFSGEALVPLNTEQLRREVRHLVDDLDVQAIAVCFLESFVNPQHEIEAEQVIREMYPDIFVTLSHRVFPVRGETRRWTTAVLNSFVQARAELYLNSLSSKLRSAGLRGGLFFAQGLGGGISLGRAKEYPLALLGSGPAGGALGATALGQRMGIDHLLLGDMGGTSFDTGIIIDNEIRIEKNLEIGPFQTGVNLVDVVSVGAGGGSIAHVGERGVPQVGPQSAASDPGPAALGKGGLEPTVSDAMVAMGFIDPDRYLGGRFQLYPEKSGEALSRDLTDRFGWSVEEAAAAVHDLVVVNMATAVREISVEKGHDPRDFVFLAYGGTLPLFAMQVAERLGITRVVIPHHSSVFCAMGLLSADFIMRNDRTVSWDLSNADEVGRVNEVADAMIEEGVASMRAEGFADEDIAVTRSADFRFVGQSFELTMELPQRPLTAEDAPNLARSFYELYEKTYGEGTAWKGVPELLLNYSVTVVGKQERPDIATAELCPRAPEDLLMGEREVYLPSTRERQSVPIYDDARFTAGSSVTGPAIIDATDTTIYVPPGHQAERDEYMNYVLTANGGSR
jgi:N-methylhydantoinase A